MIHDRMTSLARWPVVALLLVGFLACQQGFTWRHRQLGDAETPDARGWYTPDEIRDVFEAWGAERRSLYAWTEVTLDAVFPPIYGTLFAVLTARLFRVGGRRWLVVVPLVGAAADLLENITAAALAWTFDGRASPVTWAAACFTAVKTACFVGSLLILLAGGVAGLCGSTDEPDPSRR